jgi:aryl-alcohol dehydrogenase-like predicted oxidoreductase
MKIRKLGQSGLDVSALCLGGNVFGWTIDEKASFRVLDAFVDQGGTFIDTADVYSAWVPGNTGGESETIIGKWLKGSGKRSKVVIASKVGMEMPYGKGLGKNHILNGVEKSLQRLQTDFIDLYISHRPDNSVPTTETLEIYGHLIKHGKIRVAGASNYTGPGLEESIRTAHRSSYPAYQSLQPQYNLMERADYETNLEPVCREYHLGVTPYYSLASGFLTGKYRNEADLAKSARGAGVKKYLNPRGDQVLKALDEVAKETQTHPTAVSLAWLLARPGITAPIASATSPEQLRDLIQGANLDLNAEQVKRLDQASAY